MVNARRPNGIPIIFANSRCRQRKWRIIFAVTFFKSCDFLREFTKHRRTVLRSFASPRRRPAATGVEKRWKNAYTHIYRAINQTRQGSPVSNIIWPMSKHQWAISSVLFVLSLASSQSHPQWHVLTPSRSCSSTPMSTGRPCRTPLPRSPHLLSFTFPPSLSLFLVFEFPLIPVSLSFSWIYARLASFPLLASLGFPFSPFPSRSSRSRSNDAHGAYNFHIVPSRSQPSAGERAVGSLAPVAARMKESGALWSPVGSQLHESHRAARTARCGRGTENIIAPSRARRSIKIENYDRRRAERAMEKVWWGREEGEEGRIKRLN